MVDFELGKRLIAVGVPLIPGVGGDALGDGEFAGLLGVGLEGLTGMNVEGQALTVIDVDGAVHDGELGGRGVEGDAEDGVLNRGRGICAEVDAVLAAAAVELVVAEAGEGVDLGDGAAVGVAAELGEADGAVGREAGDAAIFKLDFEAAIVAGDEAHALDGGHIGLRLIEGNLIALENLDLAFDVADADGTDLALPLGFGRGGSRLIRRRCGRGRVLRARGERRQQKNKGGEENQARRGLAAASEERKAELRVAPHHGTSF